MIQRMDCKQDNVLGFRIQGKLDYDSFMRTIQDVPREKLENGNFSVVLEVVEPEGVEFQVIWKSMRYAMAHFRQNLNRIDRIAVVTDKKYLHRAAAFENLVLTGIDEKTFKLSERDVAFKWISKNNSAAA